MDKKEIKGRGNFRRLKRGVIAALENFSMAYPVTSL